MMRATGTFTVQMTPQPPDDFADGTSVARLTLDKVFEGDLTARSKGQMLSAMGHVKGSAGYVALEHVRGTLAGWEGSFVLQHSGTMNRGTPTLVLAVVPDSGTGALTTLAGEMRILIADGKHSYEFDYTLDTPPLPA